MPLTGRHNQRLVQPINRPVDVPVRWFPARLVFDLPAGIGRSRLE